MSLPYNYTEHAFACDRVCCLMKWQCYTLYEVLCDKTYLALCPRLERLKCVIRSAVSVCCSILAFANFGQRSGLLVNMDDVIACSATWEAHLRKLEDMFRALRAAGLTLKTPKIHFGPKEVHYFGHVLSADGIRMGNIRVPRV